MRRHVLFILIIVICVPVFSYVYLQENNSEYVTHVLQDGKKKEKGIIEPVELLFVGDIMLDRGVANHAERHGVNSLFSGVRELLADADIVVGNLEGTITDNTSVSRVDNSILRFTFDPMLAVVLKDLGFSALSLANNHSSDFGSEGFVQTHSYLQGVGIHPFGSAVNSGEISTNIKSKGKNICFVGYHDLYVRNSEIAIDEIVKIRSGCDYVVLFAHWGDEYEHVHNPRQTELAHAFIDAGADLVIGAHPHVVQPLEIYKNKAIFYSLGNFMFDQDFSFGTQHGLAVKVVLAHDETRFILTPIAVIRAEASMAQGPEGKRVLEYVVTDTLPSYVASEILDSQQFVLNK